MEEWSNLRDGSAMNKVENFQDSQLKKGSACDHDFSLLERGFDESKNRLRGLFNQVLVEFLEGDSVQKCMKPLPALCSNGKPVDLFKLFWVVRRLGGYDFVSRENLWDFVGEECGLGSGAMASVKLIYLEYLYKLDHWLWQGLKDGKFLDDGDRVVKKLEELLQDVMKELEDFRDGRRKKGKPGASLVSSEAAKCENGIDFRKKLVCRSSSKDRNEVYDCMVEESCENDDEICYLDNDNNLVGLAKKVIEKVINEVHGFSEGRTCNDGSKSCSQNGNDVTESTKKLTKKGISGNAFDSADVDEEKFFPQVSGDMTLSSNSSVDLEIHSRKRKRESSSFSKMLRWVKNVAEHPDEKAVGRIPDPSKWKDHGNEELWVQALLARGALLIRRHVNLPVESSLPQKKLKMHPSMYDDGIHHQQSVEKSRCSQRLPLVKSHSCSCCNSAPQRTAVIHPKTEAGCRLKESDLLSVDVDPKGIVSNGLLDGPSEKEVSVGPLFQAEVPEWTGDVYESDAKWLGIQVWPPKDLKDEPAIECDPIEKGRPNACDCSFPGHTECIRFHIAEKRLKLKRELGSVFYNWRFNRMGEEVSLSWTMEEEKRFKDMIKFSHQRIGKFWINAFKFFPSKTREQLVSYYYNVFVVRRRSYQNRVTPKDVDSDDDEKESGSIGGNFGYKAIYVPELRLPVCCENRQCSELE